MKPQDWNSTMKQSDLLIQLRKLMPTGTLDINSEERNISAQFGLHQLGHPPICIIHPGNTDELGDIIQFANETNLNLTVTSSTGAHRKGGIINHEQHILVNLSHWKNIDLIDRRNRVCRVEPGVTYAQLVTALAPHGMTIPMPLAPRNGKSVLAAVMDREPSTWANKQWDSADPVCSTEFFFGSGERFRTGAAGGPGSIEQQRESGGAQKHSAGPSQTDFHRVVMGSQGTMGIVNWITLRTEIMPTIQEAFLVSAEKLDHLLEYVYAVQRGLLGEQSFILNRTAAALLMSPESVQAFGDFRSSLPEFICLQNIAGFERLPQKRLTYHKQDIEDIVHQNGLQLEPVIGKLSASKLLDQVTKSCGEKDWRDTLKGDCLSIIFQSTLNRIPALLKVFREIAVEFGIDNSEIGVYIQPMVQNHACHIELIIPADPDSSQQIEHLRQLERQATVRLMESGAFFSRPYGSASDLVWDQNLDNTRLVETIKGIFDPKQVLQGGKWFTLKEPQVISTSNDRDISELENIVGKQWVSTVPCVLDTYAYYMNPETINKDGSQWLPRPSAVVLPQSTTEVQEKTDINWIPCSSCGLE